MKASKLCFLAAVLAAIAGMLWGLHMAISENHAALPAHAHLNLLGWVSLFLFGIFYRLHPSLDATKVALVQVWVWIIGTIVMAVGVGLITTGTTSAEPIAAVGSLIVLADMVLFAWLVFRSESAAASA
jgi:cbb3-type cytochrome oxidase subunit 1